MHGYGPGIPGIVNPELLMKDLANEFSLTEDTYFQNLLHKSNIPELQRTVLAISIKEKSPVLPSYPYETRLSFPSLNGSLSNIQKFRDTES